MRKGNEFDLKEGRTAIRVAIENKKTDNFSNYRFLKEIILELLQHFQ
jgi:hypothetical protein